MPNPRVRLVTITDAPQIAKIYGHHVLNGTATFDFVPPIDDEWHSKISTVLEKQWPFLVAEIEGEVAGYTYATQFRDRPAYAETCENSIYVDHDKLGSGIGTAMLKSLLIASKESGFRQMIAVIGGGEPASVALHQKCGFEHAGRMHSVGFKFGKYLDTVYMQRAL